jgi:hypothetical protein
MHHPPHSATKGDTDHETRKDWEFGAEVAFYHFHAAI